MDYTHFKGILLGFIFLLICLINSGSAIRCFTCDVTSAASYADANDKCNRDGSRECPSSEDSACMLEGFLRESNTVRVSKTCMRGCPLYINTTAEVVRCCTEDGCNAKFEPIPARRPSVPPRGYNPNRGYNVPSQGTNRPFQPNTVDIKRLDVESSEVKDKDVKPSEPTPLPENVTVDNHVNPGTKTPKDKVPVKKNRKSANERNSLAEQKSKKVEAGKSSSHTATGSGHALVLAILNSVLIARFKL